MIERFDVFVVAKEFYEKCKCLKLPQNLTDQLLRASSSIALNVAEGSGKRTLEDQRRFYTIAFGSLRECQAILLIENVNDKNLLKLADRLGAMLFKLSKKQQKR
jgi:four helix bundle protein